MSTSYPDTNLPANYRPPAQPRRGNSMKREDSSPPPNEDDWPLANVFASILDDELSLGPSPAQTDTFFPPVTPGQRRSVHAPYKVGENVAHVNMAERARINESIIHVKRIRDEDKDGVIFFISSRYRRPFFIIFVIFLMAATGNLSEIIQFLVKYL